MRILPFVSIVVGILAVAGEAQAREQASTVVCGAKTGERQTCSADTRGGVTLVKPLGTAACELGRTWGYDAQNIWVSDGCAAEFSVAQAPAQKFGRYTPMVGLTVADTDRGTLTIRLFTYLRYLNQQGTDESYTNAFGQTRTVQQRQDFQLNKMQIYFQGWLMNPRFRYLAYVWTSNTSLGQSTQVVVAGNLRYTFSDAVTLGAGINGSPGVRSMEGTFPFWLAVDTRHIADEYFRPSYTTAVWLEGALARGVDYKVSLGNNLSQFGIDAGQLDPGLDTLSGMLAWMPTTGEFGRGFGDFELHQTVATRLAAHYTRSDETRQGQPTDDAFDNVQIRVSDGSIIFAPGLFAPGTQIEEATYHLFAVEGGVKYRGLSLEAEHYRRRVDNFSLRTGGALPFTELTDTGFQVQGSAMPVPSQLQVYAGASKVFGEYGDPSDVRAGATFFPWRNQVVRWNFEYIYLKRAPVGALSLPYSVGSNGSVFHSNFMIWF